MCSMATCSFCNTEYKNDNSSSKEPLIKKYPTPLSREYGTDVRVFDEKLFMLLDALKQTIAEHNFIALSAFEIGSYFNIIVYKNEVGEFVELINPVQISHSGECFSREKTYYYGDLEATVKRFCEISIVYEDRDAMSHSVKFSGEIARVLQRELDYLFGSTFIDRLTPNERKKFENQLATTYQIPKKKNPSQTFFIFFGIVVVVTILLYFI